MLNTLSTKFLCNLTAFEKTRPNEYETWKMCKKCLIQKQSLTPMALPNCSILRYFGPMIITRWQAPMVPSKELAFMILESEGLEPYEETYNPQGKVPEHRHPFCEVRMIVRGEMMFNIQGNQFLLRAGDRVEIPANTKHSHVAQGSADCVCVCGLRPI